MPLHVLLPTCSAIVHQGGIGGVLTAVVAGVPQLVIQEVTGEHENSGGVVRADADGRGGRLAAMFEPKVTQGG
jgi:UDP:flavonoid glycosyltransferase YjiC (YdhE family)